jgi:tetratricopeptide (TPR) repeat protein
MLIDSSDDDEQANGLLVELTKLVGQHVKQSGATTAAAEQTAASATPFADPLRDLQGRLVDALAPRKLLTAAQLIYLGDACMGLGRDAAARDIYGRVLTEIDRNESAKASAGAAVIGIRARFVSLLRSEGKLDEASAQVNALLKERPNALEALMEKGHILQSLAERDPKRYDECIAHWTDLRILLGRSTPRQPEYYDVLYNAAACLVQQSRLTNNKEKALQAEQMLKLTLTLNPNLNGRESVAKYNALLSQAASMRGAGASTTPPRAKR